MNNSEISTANNLQILFEDNHIIVINKRSGDIVQGDKTGDTPLSDVVKLYLKNTYHKPGKVFLGVTHRLDRPTTGLVIFAKTSKALTRFNALFASKDITKTYWAIVKNTPPKNEDCLTHWLKKNEKTNKSSVFNTEIKDSKKAILQYQQIKKLDNFNLLEIQLETGRHHQIRAQLAYIGCPIKGDLKYGFNRSNPDGSICLHARSIAFMHPIKDEPVSIIAPPPNDALWNACLT